MTGRKAPWFVDEETDQHLAGLDLAMPAEDPPAKLWARIAGGMEGLGLANTQDRVGEGRWRAYAPGVTFKRLWTRETYLLRCEPGAAIPDHEHRSFEHTVVVAGDLVIDDQSYGPGDYLGTPEGGAHPRWTTKTGCIVLVHYGAA
ncbi:MAG: cupin domain-containing protein [Phenylobacterium sp.]|uniref:cupin domain-containing protein n=1 Tax=Phenylobacterium sp. TaxID=1871053 RepID=UPI001A4F7278|nr:cupin domain-containing protein [Phenylobacterium sp.]MBL8556590.1 cupin domain-containing protein [Phenylobacterium sp.]